MSLVSKEVVVQIMFVAHVAIVAQIEVVAFGAFPTYASHAVGVTCVANYVGVFYS